jgi:predicted NUDIX family phosphoesterase
MGIFLQAAYIVLKEYGSPLSASDIVAFAQKKGVLSSSGRTPAQTMKSKLSTDILKKNEKSLFMRSAKGKFALREWKKQIVEFNADRYQKALFDEDIVVFPSSHLTSFVAGRGLTRTVLQITDFYPLLQNMRRRLAEEDKSVIQLVSVFIVRHKNRILTYKRAKRLPESRLHDYYSLAFGGHLNPDDISPMFNYFKPDQGQLWLLRELREELRIKPIDMADLVYRGMLYDNMRDVSRQHLGITYEVLVNTEEFEIGERGFLIDAKFESVSQIESRREQFENWSTLLLDELGSEWR